MLLVILVIALALRLIAINQSLWLDEAISVNIVNALNLKSIILNFSLGDFHPPLFYVILKGWFLLLERFNFSTISEILTRLPSVFFGVGTVFATYLIGKKLFDNKTGIIAATLIATSPLHIYYSQEARMYMLAAALASLSVYFFISLLNKESFWLWLGFILSTTLMLYSDYLPYLMLPIYAIYLLINRKRIISPTLKTFIPAFILIFILIIPWFLILPRQVNLGLSVAAASPAWASVVGAANLKNLLLTFIKFTIGRISHDNNFIYALLFAPIAFFVTILFILSAFRISYKRLFLWFWFLGPILAGFAIAFFIPVFAYFRFIFVLPAFYLILASAVNTVNWTPLVRILLSGMLFVNLSTSIVYFTNDKFQREDWRHATNFVIENSTPTTAVLFESSHTFAPFDYYNRERIKAEGALESFNAEETKVKEKVKKLTENKDKVFLFQYLSSITDPYGLVFQELTKQGFVSTNTQDFEGVGFVYEFTRPRFY